MCAKCGLRAILPAAEMPQAGPRRRGAPRGNGRQTPKCECGGTFEKLLMTIVREGKREIEAQSVDDIRERVREQTAELTF